MINRAGFLVLGLLGTLGLCAVGAGCASSNAKDGGPDGSADHPIAEAGGTITCGAASCKSSEVCLVPPCACITVGDAGGGCPAPYCVAPTPENPVSCTPLDGGLSGTVTSVDGGSHICFQICI